MAQRDKATVIFIDKHQNNVAKPFQISVWFLRHWKKIGISIFTTFVCMLSLIIYLFLDKKPSQMVLVQQQNMQKSMARNISDNPEIDITQLKSKFEAIDEKLSKINVFLKKKGIKPLFTNFENNIKEGITWESLNKLTNNYNLKLAKTTHLLEVTPLGTPLAHTHITSFFGLRGNPFSGQQQERHKGLDLSGKKGDLVKSTASGKVIFAGLQRGYGNVIIVKHANGYETKYAHLSKILVKTGTSVSLGEGIGKVGSTGRSTGPHLHYEVLKNGRQVNPKSFLNYE